MKVATAKASKAIRTPPPGLAQELRLILVRSKGKVSNGFNGESAGKGGDNKGDPGRGYAAGIGYNAGGAIGPVPGLGIGLGLGFAGGMGLAGGLEPGLGPQGQNNLSVGGMGQGVLGGWGNTMGVAKLSGPVSPLVNTHQLIHQKVNVYACIHHPCVDVSMYLCIEVSPYAHIMFHIGMHARTRAYTQRTQRDAQANACMHSCSNSRRAPCCSNRRCTINSASFSKGLM